VEAGFCPKNDRKTRQRGKIWTQNDRKNKGRRQDFDLKDKGNELRRQGFHRFLGIFLNKLSINFIFQGIFHEIIIHKFYF
jgi:hypothetical protein